MPRAAEFVNRVFSWGYEGYEWTRTEYNLCIHAHHAIWANYCTRYEMWSKSYLRQKRTESQPTVQEVSSSRYLSDEAPECPPRLGRHRHLTRCNNFVFLFSAMALLYMFRVTISPIIRSTYAVYGHR